MSASSLLTQIQSLWKNLRQRFTDNYKYTIPLSVIGSCSALYLLYYVRAQRDKANKDALLFSTTNNTITQNVDPWTKSMFILCRTKYIASLNTLTVKDNVGFFEYVTPKIKMNVVNRARTSTAEMVLFNNGDTHNIIPLVDPVFGVAITDRGGGGGGGGGGSSSMILNVLSMLNIFGNNRIGNKAAVLERESNSNPGKYIQFGSDNERQEWFDAVIKRPMFGGGGQHLLPASNQLMDVWTTSVSNFDALSDDTISLIAFNGFGTIYTKTIQPSNERPLSFFVNDVSFLQKYAVRSGYLRYGAIAYFDRSMKLTRISILNNNNNNNNQDMIDVTATDGLQSWAHAKWIWRVSVSVATFLCQYIAVLRFKDVNAFVSAIHFHLNPSHPLRRVLLPFSIGAVKGNGVFAEYLSENGLLHHCLAFEYASLVQLMTDTMQNYKWRLFKKRFSHLKALSADVCPAYHDFMRIWLSALRFMEDTVRVLYGEDVQQSNNTNDNAVAEDQLLTDKELAAFYRTLTEKLGLSGKFRFKRFNVVHVLAHFVCVSTVLSRFLSSAVSFDYCTDINFVGLKIRDNGNPDEVVYCNDIQSYVEYCTVVFSKMPSVSNVMMMEEWQKLVQLSSAEHSSANHREEEQNAQFEQIFATLFQELKVTQSVVEQQNSLDSNRVAPFFVANPKHMQSSIMVNMIS